MDFSSIIKTVAPWIGTTLAGPLGGMAVEAACNALGLSEKTVDSVKKAVSGATSEQLMALKKADQDFALQMQAMGYTQIKDLEALAVDDRKDARGMLIQIKSMVPAILSVFITIGFFGILFGMLTGKLEIKDSQALLILLGSLTVAFTQVMNFWFGSTSSSDKKTEIISQSPAMVK